MSGLLETYRSLPRAARWGVAAVGAVLGYFVVVEPVVDTTLSLNARADARAEAIREVRIEGASESTALGLRMHGQVDLPGDARERAVAFDRRVLAVLESHAVKDHTSTTRTVPLTTGPLLAALAPTNQRVERRIREVQFEASPEALSGVLADLERTPEVAAVSRVQIRKGDDGGRAIRATVAVETWVLTKKGTSR